MRSRYRPKVLLLGSEPFGGLSLNPAAEVVGQFAGNVSEAYDVVGAVVPVSYTDLPTRIASLVATIEPAIAIGLGLFVGASCVRVETTAINIADFDVVDNHGVFVRNQPLEVGGPGARLATYNAPRIASALRADGIPARVSHHAGTHLCNLTLFNLLKACAGESRPVICGFIHLPLMPHQAAEIIENETRQDHSLVRVPTELASMDLAMQRRAVEIVLAEAVAGLPADSDTRSRILSEPHSSRGYGQKIKESQ